MEEKLDIYTEDGNYSNEKIKALIESGYGKLALVKYIKESAGTDLITAKSIVDNACGDDTRAPKGGCMSSIMLVVLILTGTVIGTLCL